MNTAPRLPEDPLFAAAPVLQFSLERPITLEDLRAAVERGPVTLPSIGWGIGADA